MKRTWIKSKYSGDYSGPMTPELSRELCLLFGIDPKYEKLPVNMALMKKTRAGKI